jgi:gamma-glutamyltranspeptidase/glutathione hydrolase
MIATPTYLEENMVKKTRGVIAAGNQKTAEAGQLIFELGGNAFDAVVSAILAACVVESVLTSAGGGGFLLAHTQDNKNILFDFFSQTPRYKKQCKDIDFYGIHIDFGEERQEFHIGRGSIAVPGCLAGIFAVHQKLGRLPFKIVAEPALNYAKNGFLTSHFNALCYQLLAPILLKTEASKNIYAPQGSLLTQGETCYMKDFADTLNYLCEQGVKEFYQGEIANQMIKDLAEGGYLTQEDLSHYQVIERKPLKINYRGYELLTNPPPSSGGTLIAFTLELLEKCNLEKIQFSSQEHISILAHVMALTNRARKDGYDTYLYQDDIIDYFLSGEHLNKYQQQLQTIVNKWGSTTHISVMDQEGNAASVTTSNGEGSSYIIPGTGIMLNNMLGEADLNPLGFHQWQENQRISSMMSPTIILKNGQPQFVLGSGGSNRIRTAILQVISNLIDFHLPIDLAVKSPRVHWENNIFSLEPFPGREMILNHLKLPKLTRVVPWQQQNMFYGGVHTVGHNQLGDMQGAGDPRREGVSI